MGATTDACAFCAVVAGAADAVVVHADEHCIAFLDHRPLFLGHTLLVPRRHVTTFAELEPAVLPSYMAVAQRLEVAVEQAMESDGSMLLVNNVVSQSVPHLHLHVIPRRFKDGLRFWLGPRRTYPDELPMQEVARRISAALA